MADKIGSIKSKLIRALRKQQGIFQARLGDYTYDTKYDDPNPLKAEYCIIKITRWGKVGHSRFTKGGLSDHETYEPIEIVLKVEGLIPEVIEKLQLDRTMEGKILTPEEIEKLKVKFYLEGVPIITIGKARKFNPNVKVGDIIKIKDSYYAVSGTNILGD